MMKFKIGKFNSGTILLQAFVFGSIAVVLIGALVSWAGTNIKASRVGLYREQALQIAEAGVDYYRWHLAHAPSDFQDGKGVAGPYIHDFFDKDGAKIGTFTLDITAPPIGSTLVKIKSTGRVLIDPAVKRSILVQMAIPSIAKYAVVANSQIRFGAGTEVFGPIHSNDGIRFDGLAHNIISSSVDSYQDPDHSGGGQEFGVHTHIVNGVVDDSYRPLEAPPNVIQNRTDVFEAGRLFPVPAVDFVGITTNMSQVKSKAQAGGQYIPNSSALGYHIVLKTNDTFDLYKVTQLYAVPQHCTNNNGENKWGSWSIKTQTLIANYPLPSNGLIFVEDNVWVDGQINTARVTIVAAKFPDNPSQRTSITINDNLLYTNYDGQDAIGLISQENINIGLFSSNNMRIDAALISQNGRVGRYYYSSDCTSSYIKGVLTLYGMIASNARYGFAFTDGTGYQIRNIIYDANLLYGPPPSFPLTTDQYQTVSWQEVQ